MITRKPISIDDMKYTIADKPSKIVSAYLVFDSDDPDGGHVEINAMDPDDPGEVVTAKIPTAALLSAYKRGSNEK